MGTRIFFHFVWMNGRPPYGENGQIYSNSNFLSVRFLFPFDYLFMYVFFVRFLAFVVNGKYSGNEVVVDFGVGGLKTL